MLNLRIETFLSYTLGKELKEKKLPRKEQDRQEIINEILPIGSAMRDIYELGKRYYVPSERKMEEIEILEKNSGVCSMDSFIEYTLSKIKENKDE